MTYDTMAQTYQNMPYEAYNDCLLIMWNLNKTTGEIEPVQVRDEAHAIHGSMCGLKGVPSEFHHVNIENMIEVKNKKELADNEFIVDYVYGLIRFSPNMNNKVIMVKEYWAKGNYYYPSNRLYYEIKDDGTIVTVHDIVNKIREDLEITNNIALQTDAKLKSTITTGNQTDTTLRNAIELARQLITELGVDQYVKHADTGNETGKIPISNGTMNVNLNAEMVGGKKVGELANSIHTHTKSQITDFPTKLPADGGNSSTVGGRTPESFANAVHTHKKADITDMSLKTVAETGDYNDLINKPSSLPANGGNANTIGNKGVNDFVQNSDNTNILKMKYDSGKQAITAVKNSETNTLYMEKANYAKVAETTVKLNGLEHNSYGQQTTENITYYVNPSTGNDNNDGLSLLTPFKTIQHALDICPKLLRHYITIKLAEGEYRENISTGGFLGRGGIILRGDTNDKELVRVRGILGVYYCMCGFNIQNITFDADISLVAPYISKDEYERTAFFTVTLGECIAPFIYDCYITQTGISTDYIYGIYVNFSPTARIKNTKVRNMKAKIRGAGIMSDNGSDLFCWNCDVNGTSICYYTQAGTIRVNTPILPSTANKDYDELARADVHGEVYQ